MQRKLIYIGGVVYVVIYCTSCIVIYSYPNLPDHAMFITFSATYAILSISYTLTITYMLHTLNKLTDDGLKSQINSVKKQFILFFAGFMMKMIYYFVEIFCADQQTE